MLNLKCDPAVRAIGSIARAIGPLSVATPAAAANDERIKPRRSVACDMVGLAKSKRAVQENRRRREMISQSI